MLVLAAETFKHYTDRLASILVEKTISTLPNDEVEVTTPHGKKYKGLALEDDHPLLGVLITRDGRLLEPALKSALPGLQVASVWTSRGADGNKQVDKHNLPTDISNRRVRRRAFASAPRSFTVYSNHRFCCWSQCREEDKP